MVAVITGQFNDQANHRAMVIDLVPAGLEIENERLTNTRRTGDLAWLPELSGGTYGESSYVEYRDDRYIAAFDTRPGAAELHVRLHPAGGDARPVQGARRSSSRTCTSPSSAPAA